MSIIVSETFVICHDFLQGGIFGTSYYKIHEEQYKNDFFLIN